MLVCGYQAVGLLSVRGAITGKPEMKAKLAPQALPTRVQKKIRQRLGYKTGFRRFVYVLSIQSLKMRFPGTASFGR